MWRTRGAALAAALALCGCGSDEPSKAGTTSGATSGAGGAGGSSGASTGAGGVMTSGNIAAIAGGRYHTCLATKSGAVYCWGQGAYGALGNDGSYEGLPTKALVIDDAIDIHCGGRFTCARRKAGTIYCWGEDQAGQLGGPETKQCGDATIDSGCAPVPQVVAGIDQPGSVGLGR